jgi:hypothetical protein
MHGIKFVVYLSLNKDIIIQFKNVPTNVPTKIAKQSKKSRYHIFQKFVLLSDYQLVK